MRVRTFSTVGCLLLLAICIPPLASAGAVQVGRTGGGDPFTLWFDENGNGLISQNGAVAVPDPGFLAVDPISGITTLAYALPEPVIAGDVGIQEPGLSGVLSDGLRFENGILGVTAVMFYFSDNSDGAVDMADNGFPSNFPCCVIAEVGPENDNRFDWFPGGNIYHGVSDAPEPSSLLLLGSGVLGALGLARRRFLS